MLRHLMSRSHPLDSYYGDSHRALQREARDVYEKEVFPHADEWEEAGM